MADELKPENSEESFSGENPVSVSPGSDVAEETTGLKPSGNEAASPGASTQNSDKPAVSEKPKYTPKKDKEKEDSAFPFSVTVGKVYDGPLDLLLDLIRKQDIDIYDIPIAKITAQFLAYV